MSDAEVKKAIIFGFAAILVATCLVPTIGAPSYISAVDDITTFYDFNNEAAIRNSNSSLVNAATQGLFSTFTNESSPMAFASDGCEEQLLQFIAGRHVLVFDSQGVYLVGLDYALRIKFAGDTPERPAVEASGTVQGNADPLGRVAYSGVLSTIDVVYSTVDGGIAESTYIVHPCGDSADISLRYNVPVKVIPDGRLCLYFDTGYMAEDA